MKLRHLPIYVTVLAWLIVRWNIHAISSEDMWVLLAAITIGGCLWYKSSKDEIVEQKEKEKLDKITKKYF
ncbi:MAG: hypothetical protein Q7S26_02370 [bacterium]|nr:hypothetical protein [bacterium]